MTLRIVSSGLNRPLPIEVTAVSKTFWEGLDRGEFLLQTCTGCARINFPPRAVCPNCHCTEFYWHGASGRAVLYSRTRVLSSPPLYGLLTPFTIGVIDLEENVRLLTRLLPGPGALAIGDTCELVVVAHPDGYHFAAAGHA